MTRPDGSFGWKKVLLAGIDSLASATSTIWRTGVPRISTAARHAFLADGLLRLGQRVDVAHRLFGNAEERVEDDLVEEVGVEGAQAGRGARGEEVRGFGPGLGHQGAALRPARAKA